MEKLILIDSNAIIHRAYHALPKDMATSSGELTNAVYGYTTTLIKILEDLKPDYIAASFDVSKATFRHEAYKEYKATRVAADQELYDQIPKVRELLEVLDIPIYEKEGYEADDCIGTIADKIRKSGLETYIVSGDKDLFQLLNGEVFVYWLKKGLSESQIINGKVVKEQFNLDPEDFIDLKALAGDPSDNIPGVPGIGPKTATDLIQKFDTLKKLYEEIEKKGLEELGIRPRVYDLLVNNKEQAFLSQKLATIDRNVPIEFNLEDCRWGKYDKVKLKEFFEGMQFHSLLKRFGVEPKAEVKTQSAKEQAKKDEQLKLL